MVEDRNKEYQHMMEWSKFIRRHNATIFDVIFRDVDYKISDDDINSIIQETADFFGLPYPKVKACCDKLAEVMLNEDPYSHEFILGYNLELLKKAGANNRETLTLCLTHELCHEFYKNTTFLLCRSERWTHELACDYICGIRSCKNDLATGKYKYIVGQMPATDTHPPGDIRVKIVAYARDFYNRLLFEEKRCVTFETAMEGFPIFVYRNAHYLNNKLKEAKTHIIEEQLHYKPITDDDINNLTDNNLIKQYVLKLREQEKE